MTTPTDEVDIETRLAAFVDQRLGRAGHRVDGMVRLSGGASRETFAVDLIDPDAHLRPLIMQRVRAGALSATFSMDGEAALLGAAQHLGVPVPTVVAATDDPGVIGAPFTLVERLDGETLGRRLLRDDEFASARGRLVAQCAQALAAIHQIPTDAAPHLRRDDPVGQLRGLLDLLGAPHPAFEIALHWLEANRPEVTEDRVVHGDFRLGNLLVDTEGLSAVLDWELAHLGDAAEDLGWFCVRAWRFGAEAPVAGVGEYEELLDAYEAAGGRRITAAQLRWWETLGTLRWGVICIVQASAHLSGASRSVELAAIGRRVCENEYDVLRLVAPEIATAGAAADDVPAFRHGPELHGRPDAAVLVDAVREYLERDVAAATEGRVRFHARVAANVLAMVERELAAGDGPVRRHRDRLQALDVDSDEALAAALRDGSVDASAPAVRAAVYADVVDKLRIANPGYLVEAAER